MVLDVYLGDALVATLEQASPARLRLRYTPAGTALGRPLSVALPVRDAPYEHEDCAPFFDGLLPEGAGLGVLTRMLGTCYANSDATSAARSSAFPKEKRLRSTRRA